MLRPYVKIMKFLWKTRKRPNERNVPQAVTRPRSEVVEGPIGGTTIDKFANMVRDLNIAQA